MRRAACWVTDWCGFVLVELGVAILDRCQTEGLGHRIGAAIYGAGNWCYRAFDD